MSEKVFKSVNIWQSYKQERGCLMHFARLANTLLNDEESARDSHVQPVYRDGLWRSAEAERNRPSLS